MGILDELPLKITATAGRPGAAGSTVVKEELCSAGLFPHKTWATSSEWVTFVDRKTDLGSARVINAQRTDRSCEQRGKLLSETLNQICACGYSD